MYAPAHFMVRHKLLTTHEVESPTWDPSEDAPTASSQSELANYSSVPSVYKAMHSAVQ